MKPVYRFVWWAVVALSSSSSVVSAQTDSLPTPPKWGKLELHGSADVYYGYGFGQPQDKNIPYLVNSNRHNELNVNLINLDLRYTHDRVRARLMPAFGTYMMANYGAEPAGLRYLLEANVGVRPFKKHQIWVDAGIMGAPYTNEGPLSHEHLMYTRSLLPETSPFYLAAVRLTVPFSKRLTGYFYLTNGWQQIADVNKHKSFGSKLDWNADDKNTLTWTTYLGDERSDAAPDNRMRYFTDLQWVHNFDGKFSAAACAYGGIQRRLPASGGRQTTHPWVAANFTARYRPHEAFSLSARLEYFYDPDRAQIHPVTPVNGGFHVWGGGLCLNAHLFDHALFRIEGRAWHSLGDPMFLDKNQNNTPWSLWLVSSLTAWF